ncbi:uncharacterized protein LOC111349834 [Spodoptera litura]|uniref:Uncharacterized protein LOC111349834 n=1 Tax=Spodoptera litura TaxID=69820 RepID=A0A9J7IJE7_SPOLT|nr:uncharacterized protein LOC111349834 [Spodoptera litura]
MGMANLEYSILAFAFKTLSSYSRLLEFGEALKNIKYDVIGLAEIRRLGNSIEEYEDFILYYIGQTPGLYGVGFLVHKRHKANIIYFKGISERVALLQINVDNTVISIIQCYAPTESAKEKEVELFYKNVNKALKTSGKHLIVMGDFNAKIGQPKQAENLITKSYGYGHRNRRGEKLIQFACENKLAILNTFFKKKNNRRWTWRSPNGKVKNEIDYILTNLEKYAQDIQVINIKYPSDHRLVRATFTLQSKRKNRKSYGGNVKNTLKNEQQVQSYKDSLYDNLAELANKQHSYTVQELYSKIAAAINISLKTAQEVSKHKDTDSIISARTRLLMLRRQYLQNTKPKTRTMKNELKALYKLISKYIRNDYDTHRKKTIEKHIIQYGSLKRANKELRSHKTWIEGLKASNKTTYERKEILKVATNFYRELYDYENEEPPSISTIISEIQSNIQDVDETEVMNGIASLKLDKSPGPDKITNEALKLGSPYLKTPLTQLFNMVLKTANKKELKVQLKNINQWNRQALEEVSLL